MIKILIFGKGKIGKALFYFLSKKNFKVNFFEKNLNLKNYHLFFGALPGKIGSLSLKFALKEKKDLIDISDLEPQFYLKKKKEIEKAKITVVANCGFCPGLLNFLIAFYTKGLKKIRKIEVFAGTLAPKKRFFFPFLWCFEDLILEHKISSIQLINKKEKIFKPFSNLKREKFFDIPAESYFAPSGFEQLIKKIKTENFIFRVVRPLGFYEFYKFLENYGFFKKENLEKVKKILENKKEDNLTFSKINIKSEKSNFSLIIKSLSNKNEKLDSMQKISVFFPLEIAKNLIKKRIKKGLIFPEELTKESFAKEILERLKTSPFLKTTFQKKSN